MFNALYDRVQDKQLQELDRHHILFPRKKWDTGLAKRLRDNLYLKAQLPVDIHRELHRQIDRVPLPPATRIKEMVFILEDLRKNNKLDKDDNFVGRINLLLNIWERYPECQPTCNVLKQQKQLVTDYKIKTSR